MSTSEGLDGVEAKHRQATAGFVIKIIQDSEVDEYLKAIVDAVKDRKSELENVGVLPMQKKVEKESIEAFSVTPKINVPIPQQPPVVNTANGGAPRYYGKKGGSRINAHKSRPASDLQVFAGIVPPLRDLAGLDSNAVFGFTGLMYAKRDVINQCFKAEFEGHSLRFQVIGVGPKAVKILMVDEPPIHIQHNKKSLHAAWQNNEPVFIGHAALAPWLGRN
jgi:hypothetical protein